MKRVLVYVCIALSVAGCSISGSVSSAARSENSAGGIEYFNPDGLVQTEYYSQVVGYPASARVYEFSAITAVKGDLSLSSETDIELQASDALENLDVALKSVGASKEDVVRVSVYVSDENPQTAYLVGEALLDYFQREQMPVGTYVGGATLISDRVKVQFDATAVKIGD